MVGGFHGGAYMTGSALGKAVVFGRLAARSALS
jgi:fumarate reductase flavoprotein subunit